MISLRGLDSGIPVRSAGADHTNRVRLPIQVAERLALMKIDSKAESKSIVSEEAQNVPIRLDV